jgi:branched-chain amino acid aminotransferase
MNELLSAQDRGLLLGDGVFDTLAVYRGAPQLMESHISRLVRHAAAIHISINADLVHSMMLPCLEDIAGRDCILRTTVTRGVTSRGLWPEDIEAPTILCHATPFDRAVIGEPAKLIVSAIARNDTSPTSRIKSLAYLDHVLAAREAHQAGADDALFLNSQGAITCTTIGNVFVQEGNVLITPLLSDGALDGVIREILLNNPPDGFKVVEQTIPLERALKADAMVTTNSVRLARPVTKLNSHVFDRTTLHRKLLIHIQELLAAAETDLQSN